MIPGSGCKKCCELWSWPGVYHLPGGCPQAPWRIRLGDHILLHACGNLTYFLGTVIQSVTNPRAKINQDFAKYFVKTKAEDMYK